MSIRLCPHKVCSFCFLSSVFFLSFRLGNAEGNGFSSYVGHREKTRNVIIIIIIYTFLNCKLVARGRGKRNKTQTAQASFSTSSVLHDNTLFACLQAFSRNTLRERMTERKVFTLGGKTFTRSDVLARKVKDVLFGYALHPCIRSYVSTLCGVVATPNLVMKSRLRLMLIFHGLIINWDRARRHNLEAKLKPDEEKLILDVLRQGHPRADEKIGCGLKVIKVGAHPQYPESRCFHIVRTDDSTADFSYRKVLHDIR